MPRQLRWVATALHLLAQCGASNQQSVGAADALVKGLVITKEEQQKCTNVYDEHYGPPPPANIAPYTPFCSISVFTGILALVCLLRSIL